MTSDARSFVFPPDLNKLNIRNNLAFAFLSRDCFGTPLALNHSEQ